MTRLVPFLVLALSRRRGGPVPSSSVTPGMGELTEAVRCTLPLRFESVGEALAAGRDAVGPCSVVGRDVARDGAGLGEALSGLRTTYHLVLDQPPDFAATEALAVSWSEATLEYLHDLSCEDPLTGLASLAHLRTRLAELYRDAELCDVSARESHALVVVELRRLADAGASRPGDHFTRTLRLVQVAEAMRAVYSGGQTIGRLGQDRAAAVVSRDADLGATVSVLRALLHDELGGSATRLWIEGLPPTPDSATRLLDDLTR